LSKRHKELRVEEGEENEMEVGQGKKVQRKSWQREEAQKGRSRTRRNILAIVNKMRGETRKNFTSFVQEFHNIWSAG